MTPATFDVVIVGAGISGVGTAVHLQQRCPGKRYAILEDRAAMGGTWDLFRYPGIRSDSDLHTYAYAFKPWRGAKAIADGPSILAYLKETAVEHGVDPHIRYRHRVVAADWSSESGTWTVTALRHDNGDRVSFRCSMLAVCAGYYRYRAGYTPVFDGIEQFAGTLVHPQHWPEDLDYGGKRVVVIGSGATAMTLVPAMAPDVAHIVMVQRSPTYVIAWPAVDRIANFLRRVLPERWAYALVRRKNVGIQQWLYRRARERPHKVRKWLLDRVREELGPDYDVATHFTPRYGPWEQRLCLVPDSDLFVALRSGKASVVTDQVERFTERGIRLRSGRELEADIVVTATGLDLVPLGDIELTVDGAQVDVAQTWSYEGMMYTGVPNLVSTFGYVNASWTLRADLTARFLCDLVERMDRTGARKVTPRLRAADADMPARPFFQALTSGYMQRVQDRFPRQGDREPWLKWEDYARDRKMLRLAARADGALVFEGLASTSGARVGTEPAVAAAP